MNWKDNLSEFGRAIAEGDLDYVKAALATGIDPNGSEEAPLLVATVESQKEIAKYLLEAGADPNIPHLPEWSCLTEAVARNDLEWVEFLSGYGARVGAMVSEGQGTELHLAAKRGYLDIVRFLFENSGGQRALELFDDLNETPLIAAAGAGQLEIVRFLLNVGADANALVQMTRDDKIGDTPISRAVRAGHPAVVELLLERGADPYRPGWMWSNAWDQIGRDASTDCSEMEKVLNVPELRDPSQTPYKQELESQLLYELGFHGCHSATAFDWDCTEAIGSTFTLRGKLVRPFNHLRALDERGRTVAEGDVDFLVLTREIEVRAFWSRLVLDGRSLDLRRGVPLHVVAQLTEDQKSWVVMDSRNYCGRLDQADLNLIQ